MPTRKNATKSRSNSAATLNVMLADTAILLGKTQACHWNAQGPGFHGLHKLTEAQYAELFAAMDALAERVRAVGAPAPDGLAEMLELARLEPRLGITETAAACRALAEDNTRMAQHARDAAEAMEEAGDIASHDLLVARVAAHEKAAWLLRSELPSGGAR